MQGRSETGTDRLSGAEARQLRTLADEFEHRRSLAGEVAGVISAIPAPVARALLQLKWTVDESGAWISPRDGRIVAWRQALEEECERAR